MDLGEGAGALAVAVNRGQHPGGAWQATGMEVFDEERIDPGAAVAVGG